MALYTKEELDALSRGELVALCVRVARRRAAFLSVEVDEARGLVDQWEALMAKSGEAAGAGGLEPEIENLRRRMVSFLDAVGLSKG